MYANFNWTYIVESEIGRDTSTSPYKLNAGAMYRTPWFFDVSAFVYGHRGLWGGGVPENSLAAFEAARAAGIGAELDVRLTADNVPVVFHDAGLERMCGHRELLARVTADELQAHRLPDGSAIPTLMQVLDVMGDLPVLIELKVDGVAGEIAERTAEAIAGAFRRMVSPYAACSAAPSSPPSPFEPYSPLWTRLVIRKNCGSVSSTRHSHSTPTPTA